MHNLYVVCNSRCMMTMTTSHSALVYNPLYATYCAVETACLLQHPIISVAWARSVRRFLEGSEPRDSAQLIPCACYSVGYSNHDTIIDSGNMSLPCAYNLRAGYWIAVSCVTQHIQYHVPVTVFAILIMLVTRA